MIKESHISIHTFPGNNFLTADVYTCQNGLNTQNIINLFQTSFNLKDTEVNFIKRGKKYMHFHNQDTLNK